MADMPRDLKEQIDKLEEQFVVTTDKLKHISDHFVKELEKGLSEQGGSIVSCSSLSGINKRTLTRIAHDSYMVHGLP